jgi:beta-phosphoglucomutase
MMKATGILGDYKAVIFDMDGVIIDSEGLHAEAKRVTLDHFQISYDERIFNDFKGRPDTVFFDFVVHELAGDLYQARDLNEYKWEQYRHLLSRLSVIPGAAEFVAGVKKIVPALGLVTSARGRDLEIADRQLGFVAWFDVVVHGDHTPYHKPHPEPYQKAMASLGTTGAETLVIEDSPNGIISAHAAGCYVIGITTTFTRNILIQAGADQVVSRFSEIPLLRGRGHPQAKESRPPDAP